ncbi:MAG: hypothetical protein AAFQ89_01230 [Cyanobacteria bacterium J06626_18]
MALENLKQQANLPTDERLELVAAVIQSLQGAPSAEAGQYLVTRAHPWRRQLYIKGRKLLASTVWRDLISNGMSPEQAAEN